jgi:hypothetical protein
MLLLHTQIRSRDTAVFGQALGVMDVPKNMFKLVDSEKDTFHTLEKWQSDE